MLRTTRTPSPGTLWRMAYAPPLHRDFARALRILASLDVGYAEAHRMLIPTASRLGLPRPSYWRVRETLIAERALRRERVQRRQRRDEIIADLLAGLVLRPMWRATQA